MSEGWPYSAALLHEMCEAFARWGDAAGCLEGVCRALVEGLTGTDMCAAYSRDDRGAMELVARFPGTQDETDVGGMLDFARRVFSGEGGSRGLDGDPAFFGASRTLNRGDGIAIVVTRPNPRLTAEEEECIRACLGFAADMVQNALESFRAAEADMDGRASQDLQAMRSEMIATLSHEIRTPLSAIKGYVTALLRTDVKWDEQTKREFLEVINEECDKMERMTSSIMDIAAMESGKVSLERFPTLLNRLIAEVVSKMAARCKKHRFLVNFEADFPVVTVDPLRIEQVAYNLLDNAVKYSPGGGLIVVSGRTLPDHVVIGVADQGRGIPAEHLNRLFEKYYRVGSQKPVGGLGLGLPIARQLVEGHGGRIWAESTEGKGTTVYFTLPLDRSRRDRG